MPTTPDQQTTDHEPPPEQREAQTELYRLKTSLRSYRYALDRLQETHARFIRASNLLTPEQHDAVLAWEEVSSSELATLAVALGEIDHVVLP